MNECGEFDAVGNSRQQVGCVGACQVEVIHCVGQLFLPHFRYEGQAPRLVRVRTSAELVISKSYRNNNSGNTRVHVYQ